MTTAYLPEQSAIYLADSLQMLPKLRPASVRLILTDPPFNVSRKNNLTSMGRGGIEWAWDGDFDQLSWLPMAVKALMPGGSIIIWNDWKQLGGIAQFLTQRMSLDVKRDLVWTKVNPMPRNLDRSYVQAREHALWAVKVDPKHPWVFNRRKNTPYERGEFKYPVQRSDHPTKKPDNLFKELIEIHSNPGELVVDPFAGCYDPETNVLTHRGFIKWPDVTKTDWFATRSPNGDISYNQATNLISARHTGAMHHYKGRSLDLLVTPNHQMLVREHHAGVPSLIPSEGLTKSVYHIPNRATWAGNDPTELTLHNIQLEALPWLRLFGLYLAEGCIRATSRGHGIFIKQSKHPDFINAVRDTITAVKVGKFREHDYDGVHLFVLQHPSIHAACSAVGRQPVRRIPRKYLNLGPKCLGAILDGLMLGDGHRRPNGRLTYYTSSSGLAEDVAEIFIKLGWAATISVRNKPDTVLRGRLIHANYPEYSVTTRLAAETKITISRMREVVEYDGPVYCADVPPHHTLLINRNGKIAWCGNSGTTAIAAELSKRRHISFEKLPQFYNLAVKSIVEVVGAERVTYLQQPDAGVQA